ncbi:MAG: hypothetical protein LQ346_007095 [Caloplaca aetnensis]|nr:MAG: hypothetical protein LQ346_007095 [Caloplaca aetnensis]
MHHPPPRPPLILPPDVDAMMHVPERRLDQQERDDHGAQDGVPVAGRPRARAGGHPGAEAEAGERGGVGEELHGGVVPDFAGGGGGEEADQEDADGHEEDEGEAHEGGVGDEDGAEVGGGALLCPSFFFS